LRESGQRRVAELAQALLARLLPFVRGAHERASMAEELAHEARPALAVGEQLADLGALGLRAREVGPRRRELGRELRIFRGRLPQGPLCIDLGLEEGLVEQRLVAAAQRLERVL